MRVVSLVFTSLRFAPASALLIQFLSRVQSQSHPEKDLMESFSNPFRVKRVQEVRACVTMKCTISDRIIPTILSFAECAALVKDHVIHMRRVPTMAKVNIFYDVHLLN